MNGWWSLTLCVDCDAPWRRSALEGKSMGASVLKPSKGSSPWSMAQGIDQACHFCPIHAAVRQKGDLLHTVCHAGTFLFDTAVIGLKGERPTPLAMDQTAVVRLPPLDLCESDYLSRLAFLGVL